MEAKIGDRISLDAKKVGQPRRSGEVVAVAEGLAGRRLRVLWDDGSETVISPGAGVLLVEGKAKGKAKPQVKGKTKPTARAKR